MPNDMFERAKENYNRIIAWLEDIKNSGCNGVVLGLSGGKDSTVVAMLAKLVWGNDVIGIIMPNQSLEGVDDAQEIMLRLSIRGVIWPITEAYNYFKTSIYDTKALSNIAPRLRMTALYAQAQQLGYRVIGTGNRSERYIGWCTKHGDMACDFNPIAHLTCSEVIELGYLLADMFDLPYDFIQKPPADGITGKIDEDNFGFTYKQLDDFLLKGTSGNPVVDQKIEQMYDASAHKLAMPATMERE